jgi:hypothetical protein
VVVPVLVALYLPAVTYLSWQGWTDRNLDVAARIMEKLAASVVTALSASLLFLALRRRTTRSNAVLLTVACAFGAVHVGDQQPGVMAARNGAVARDRRDPVAHGSVPRRAR